MMVCLDANCVIYLVEKNPHWGPKVVARLATAKAAGDTVAVCDLARAECLIGPLKSRDALVLADYQRFFSSSAVRMLPVTPVCERAAEVRVASAMKIKLPDALHLAAAIAHGCGLFLTNDEQLKICGGITVEVLA
ncbi:MAG TPA: PIN domain-containing protein [Pirellulales bacterium]|nr:PIN domain-containing protein [Pirellulales bacterium]